MADHAYNVNTRKALRASITKIHNEKDSFDQFDVGKLKVYHSTLAKNEIEIKDMDRLIFMHKFKDTPDGDRVGEKDKESTDAFKYKQMMYECQTIINQLIEQANPAGAVGLPHFTQAGGSSTHAAAAGAINPSLSQLKRPTAPLPRFKSEEGENLIVFISNFEDVINKFNYTDYDKFILLKSVVEGKAALLLDSLEPANQTYNDAKDLLKQALASVEVQKYNTIKKLCDLRLPFSDEPFRYISEVKKIINSVRQLEITVDDFLTYFIHNGLNESFKSHLLALTNKSKPDLNEILNNFFLANERYEAAKKLQKPGKTIKSETETSAFVSSSNHSEAKNNPFEFCVLCNANHGINKCKKYVTQTEKLAGLNKINACTKCTNVNHVAKTCKFRFKKTCFYCNKWHFTFLCPDAKGSNTKPTNSKDKNLPNASKCSTSANVVNSDATFDVQEDAVEESETVCHVVSASFFQKNLEEVDSILSTFTVKSSDNKSTIRSLYDIGSQSSFVVDKHVKDLEHSVLKRNIKLTIKGINESKTVKSDLIEARLKLGDKSYSVQLLTVPEININLKLPNLNKVVTSLIQNGHTLADSFLDEHSVSLNNIGVILGANAAYCFQGETIKLGENSVYMTTGFGTMLLGSIKNILKDISIMNKKPPGESELGNNNLNQAHTNCYATGLGFARKSSNMASLDREKDEQYVSVLKDVNSLRFENCSTEVLEETCSFHLNKEPDLRKDEDNNVDLAKYLIDNSTTNKEGRFIFPLLWNADVKHLLAKNYNLAKCVLQSNVKKFKSDESKVFMIDDNLKELEDAGIIERVHDLNKFMEQHPTCSFLAHNSIFKPNKESTKVRIVFMSNLAEKSAQPNNLSHNQCMYSGPSINQKLSTALTQLRFDEKLLCFDIKKAFCQIELTEDDKNKLLFLWFKNVRKGDYTVQAFRNARLSFGLRCSPTILMVALYKMLILDTDANSELNDLKKQIYGLIYMDNGAISMANSHDLIEAYKLLPGIFSKYKFELQQFVTNDKNLKTMLDGDNKNTTDLFGMRWDTEKDRLSPKPKKLEVAAKTKRTLLKSIAENFDPFNYDGPLLNRARLFMHELQCDNSLGWDKEIPEQQKREWKNICNQLNNASPLEVDRCVGSRKDTYNLLCFCDASKEIYACVIYLHNKNNNQTSLLLAKNRIVGKNHEGKSIPSLELSAILLGTETLSDVYTELTGKQNVTPIKIEELCLYSDSLVCLNWLNSHVNKLDKLAKVSVFVKNRLSKIQKLCENIPIKYSFVDGFENPADLMSRPTSYKILKASNFVNGPTFLRNRENEISRDVISFSIPNLKYKLTKESQEPDTCLKPSSPQARSREQSPQMQSGDVNPQADYGVSQKGSSSKRTDSDSTKVSQHLIEANAHNKNERLINIERFSSFKKLIKTTQLVLIFINKLKEKLKNKFPKKYSNLKLVQNTYDEAIKLLLLEEQKDKFEDVLEYFETLKAKGNIKIPNLVKQLNCFIDNDGFIRVGNKMRRYAKYDTKYCPILLSKNSSFTNLIIRDYHMQMSHSGIYVVLAEIRKKYWIPSCFNTVKKILQKCVHCKRFNARTIKLNQNDYRDFRLSNKSRPFSSVAIDYAGPYNTRDGDKTSKVYLLVITCLYSRAINLELSVNLTTEEFLRSFQLHCYKYGLPEFVLSDMGSQLVAGADIISNFLNEPKTVAYFNEQGCERLKFSQYTKGRHELGSLIETCVKAVKRLISGAIRNNVLKLRDFQFIVEKTVSLVNKRPIAFKEALRDTKSSVLPQPITPELLIHGFELTSLDLIPNLHSVTVEEESDNSYDPVGTIQLVDKKLRNVKRNLFTLYNEEFIPHLIGQATDRKSRFEPKCHNKLAVGDIVLIKEVNTKRANLPMGIVEKITVNELSEVTDTVLLKGSTKERIRRHPSVLIPILQIKGQVGVEECQSELNSTKELTDKPNPRRNPRRLAALNSEVRSKKMLSDELSG